MNQRKAEAVLKAVEAKHEMWLAYVTDPRDRPQIVRNFHRDGDWAIVWESDSPDDWAIKWHEDPAGTFCEPIMSFVLGAYDA